MGRRNVNKNERREQKKTDKQHRLRNLNARRWHRCVTVLEPLGLAEGFQSLPEFDKERLWKCCLPGPIVEVDQSMGSASEEIRAVAESRIKETNMIVKGAKIPVDLGATILFPLLHAFKMTDALPSHRQYDFYQRARQIGETSWQEVGSEALLQAGVALAVLGNERSIVDEGYLSFRLSTDHGRRFLVNLGRIEAPNVLVNSNGQSRRGYRVGQTSARGDVEWVNWPATVFGDANTDNELPVFIQQHAIDRLRERLAFGEELDLVNHSMICSLREPDLIPKERNRYLVRFVFVGRYFLGYLLAERLSDMVLVKTFLFPTMEGTPEAAELRTTVGLVRHDIEHLRLDNIHTFLGTDVPGDPKLRALFEKVGLGDTLALARSVVSLSKQKEAEDIRKYLLM